VVGGVAAAGGGAAELGPPADTGDGRAAVDGAACAPGGSTELGAFGAAEPPAAAGAAAGCVRLADGGAADACRSDGDAVAAPITVATMMEPVATDGATVAAGVASASARSAVARLPVSVAALREPGPCVRITACSWLPAAWICRLICCPTVNVAEVVKLMVPEFVWSSAWP